MIERKISVRYAMGVLLSFPNLILYAYISFATLHAPQLLDTHRISSNYRFMKARGAARISEALTFSVEPARRSLASLLCQGFASIPSR